MPTYHSSVNLSEQPHADQSQPQAKVCSTCRSPIDAGALPVYLVNDNGHGESTHVCRICQGHGASRGRPVPVPGETRAVVRPRIDSEAPERQCETTLANDAVLFEDVNPEGSQPSSIDSGASFPASQASLIPNFIPITLQRSPSTLKIITTSHAPAHERSPPRQSAPSSVSNVDMDDAERPVHRKDDVYTALSPLTDITHLRVRSQGHHCLYPGASFRGTQKSGRNSYDVNVTIVDVDFNNAFLCGYLRIEGLTEDWPELTTYFDAEIIGSRHGFVTQNWGATEQEDMVHWNRFPAFRQVRNELKGPHSTIPDRDRGAVFMRWKERFLVPDHTVNNINGASFAGFYYVCVDFNPPALQTATVRPKAQQPSVVQDEDSPALSSSPKSARGRRSSSVHRGQSSLREPQPATMNGFYFHQHSEPYQQLSLVHMPERTTSTFEFR